VTSTNIALIAGLGNPGKSYRETRHNVGFWLLERLRREFQINFSPEKKFKAETGQLNFNNRQVRVIAPSTFMNLSGQSIASMLSFYRIDPSQLLVIHDDLDLEPGSVRLKLGGGHGGHNGLRDICSRLGVSTFPRIRIGIGHPGANRDVSSYVLKRPSVADRSRIENAVERALNVMPEILWGDFQAAMNTLHTDN
jgi:PTH1 family peptidyl-tRNA hydrolase